MVPQTQDTRLPLTCVSEPLLANPRKPLAACKLATAATANTAMLSVSKPAAAAPLD